MMNKKLLILILAGIISLGAGQKAFANDGCFCETCNKIKSNKVVGSSVKVGTTLKYDDELIESNELINGYQLIDGYELTQNQEYYITFKHEAKGSFTDILKHTKGFKNVDIEEKVSDDGVKYYEITAKIDTSTLGDLNVEYQLFMQSVNNRNQANYNATELVNYKFKVVEPVDETTEEKRLNS